MDFYEKCKYEEQEIVSNNMARDIMTFIICYDDHKSFTEDVKKRFSDSTKYRVESFHTRQEFLKECERTTDPSSCKVAIIGIPDQKEQYEAMESMTMEVKRTDPDTGMILIVPADKMDDVKKVIRFNIDAYIVKNTNSILRIHNTVKKLISERTISINRKKRNIALYVLLAFLLLTTLAILIARLKFPQYF